MKKQYNHELININNLEQGKTGNTDLDFAISNVKNEPLVLSIEEANSVLDDAVLNDATSSVIKNTILVGGAVLLSAVFGWMYYEFNHSTTFTHSTPTSNSNILTGKSNKIELSNSIQEHIVHYSDDSNSRSNSESAINNSTFPNTNIESSKSNNPLISSNVNTTTLTNGNNRRNSSGTLSSSSANNKSVGDIKKSNSNFSKTIITQRYFDDGSAKMSLEYKNQPCRITINSRGIESLFINDEEIDASYYYLYDDLASEAFRRAKIEPLAGSTHDANSKPNINAMMTGALVRRGLIKDGEKFNFELTPNFAMLNNVNLKSDLHKDLLQVYQSAFGSSLPRGGKFIIGKQL